MLRTAGNPNLNNRGQVVGVYPDSQGVVRSFVKDRRGRVTTFAVPGADATLAGCINDRGQIAGTYLDAGAAVPGGGPPPAGHGARVHTPAQRADHHHRPPGFDDTAPTDINNRGQVVGKDR